VNWTDLGTTARQRLTASRKLQIWERNRGTCCLCGQPIDGIREEWFIEHKRALELGGTNEDDNLAPAHRACKRSKDADDHSRAAKAKRVKQRFLGIRREPGRGLPGARSSNVRMTFAQGPVDRRTGRPCAVLDVEAWSLHRPDVPEQAFRQRRSPYHLNAVSMMQGKKTVAMTRLLAGSGQQFGLRYEIRQERSKLSRDSVP
jgi:hypothetical protein